MKKLLIVLALISVFTVSVFAQEAEAKDSTSEGNSKWSTVSYVNVPVLKVLDSKEGYLVIYQKKHKGVGSTVIPKVWSVGSPEKPRRLDVRSVNTSKEAYLSIIKDNGEFKRAILNMPKSRSSYVWAVLDNGVQLEGLDKEVLEDLEL